LNSGPKVGVGLIIWKDEEVLLVRRQGVHGSGTWSTPRGHLEAGESLEECASREAREETGVAVRDIRFRAITSDVFDPETGHYITVWMEGDLLAGEAEARATYELSTVAWFRGDRLPSPLFLPLKNLVDGHCYPPSPVGRALSRRAEGTADDRG
jgi:8-oxo-dGTP diphosphatase